MSITSRTSGTSRLERAAAMRIVASSEAGDASTEIPAAIPVILYIARFHPFNQGFSGIYRKFTGFPLLSSQPRRKPTLHPPQPVGLLGGPHPSACAVGTDGAHCAPPRTELGSRLFAPPPRIETDAEIQQSAFSGSRSMPELPSVHGNALNAHLPKNVVIGSAVSK